LEIQELGLQIYPDIYTSIMGGLFYWDFCYYSFCLYLPGFGPGREGHLGLESRRRDLQGQAGHCIRKVRS